MPGVLVIEPDVHRDERGFFLETWRAERYEFTGPFVQENLSYSKHGVLRGLHLQDPPQAQGKLVTVLRGDGLRRRRRCLPRVPHLRSMGRVHAVRRHGVPDLDSARLRARVRGHRRGGAVFLQVHGAVCSGLRTHRSLGRSDARDRVADPSARAVAPRRGGASAPAAGNVDAPPPPVTCRFRNSGTCTGPTWARSPACGSRRSAFRTPQASARTSRTPDRGCRPRRRCRPPWRRPPR